MVSQSTNPSKSELARWAILSDPSKSDREVSRELGVGNKTVSRARKALIDGGFLAENANDTQASKHATEVCVISVEDISPTPENNILYSPIRQDDPSFLALVESIRRDGILEPLVLSADNYILSGHRRCAAAFRCGLLEVPVRYMREVSYADDKDRFFRLLASFNRQRSKTTSEQTREEFALMESRSCEHINRYRLDASEIDVEEVQLSTRRARSRIVDKRGLRSAIIDVVENEKDNYPLSDRAIHYKLLNVPGLVRNDKTRTPYANDEKSYNDTCNMLTRLRIDGSIPFEALEDETRGVTIWDCHANVGDYVRREVDNFLTHYYRSLQQSQPNWIELLVEKNTVASQLSSVAGRYRIPMTSGRGYSSLPPRKDMVDRFFESGRETLIVLVVADHDSEGEDIPRSFGNSLRDDFGIEPADLSVIKAALTREQVQSRSLHAGQFSKATSSRYQRYVDQYGERCWELEALDTQDLRDIVEDSIRSVLDIDAFNREVQKEREEQEQLTVQREKLRKGLVYGGDK